MAGRAREMRIVAARTPTPEEAREMVRLCLPLLAEMLRANDRRAEHEASGGRAGAAGGAGGAGRDLAALGGVGVAGAVAAGGVVGGEP